MSFLTLEAITKQFPGCRAVDHLDLDINQGEFIVLLGPSGCGKTTTLRIIAGLEIQTSGRVILDGKDVSDVPPERRNMAMVFQNLALYPHMTVYENIGFYLSNIRTPKDEIRRRVLETAKRVQIDELLDRRPHQLSGGQCQRVALARALIRKPRVFLLDEPLAALDAKLRVSMRSELKLLHRGLSEEGEDSAGTFVYVTHDQIEAMTLGTRIAVINQGQVVQCSTPKELYRRPKNIFTATFVGSPEMNLTEGVLQDVGGETFFDFRGMRVPAGTKGRDALQKLREQTAPAVMGIRPESISLVAPGTPNVVCGEILTIEPFGQANFVHLKLSDSANVTCLTPPDLAVREGETVGIQFHPEAMHFFDVKTGDNLSGESR